MNKKGFYFIGIGIRPQGKDNVYYSLVYFISKPITNPYSEYVLFMFKFSLGIALVSRTLESICPAICACGIQGQIIRAAGFPLCPMFAPFSKFQPPIVTRRCDNSKTFEFRNGKTSQISTTHEPSQTDLDILVISH